MPHVRILPFPTTYFTIFKTTGKWQQTFGNSDLFDVLQFSVLDELSLIVCLKRAKLASEAVAVADVASEMRLCRGPSQTLFALEPLLADVLALVRIGQVGG